MKDNPIQMKELKNREKVLKITKQCILEKFNDESLENENTFKKAEEEFEKMKSKEQEKILKLENFKRIVNERVAIYKNAQRMLNADKVIKVFEKKENFFDEVNSKNVKRQTLSDVKSKLASKINHNKLLVIDQHDSSDNEGESMDKKPATESSETLDTKITSFALKAIISNMKNEVKDLEEQNKRYSSTRRIFADLEREKAKNYLNKCNNIQYINEIKEKKEKIRFSEELDLENVVESPNIFVNDFTQKENVFKIAKPIISKKKIIPSNLLPLCPCKSFKSTNLGISECASNCIFYKNNTG